MSAVNCSNKQYGYVFMQCFVFLLDCEYMFDLFFYLFQDQEQGTKRVCALKDRMLRALKDKNYLAADIICKVK